MSETITLILLLASIVCIFGSLAIIIYLIRQIRKSRTEVKFIVPNDSSKIDHFSAMVHSRPEKKDIADTSESPIVKLRGGQK